MYLNLTDKILYIGNFIDFADSLLQGLDTFDGFLGCHFGNHVFHLSDISENWTASTVCSSLFHLLLKLNLTIEGLPSAVIDYGGQSYGQLPDEHVDSVECQRFYQHDSQQICFLLVYFFVFD